MGTLDLSHFKYLDKEDRRGCRYIHFELEDKELLHPDLVEQELRDLEQYHKKIKGFFREGAAGYDTFLDDKSGTPIFLCGVKYTKEEIRQWAIESISLHLHHAK